MREALAIIGDVHGCVKPLRVITTKALDRAERLVFLGDYVNRGLDSAGVIDFLIDLKSDAPGTVLLKGHHDRALRECLEEGRLAEFLQMGGAATMNSYFRGSVPTDVLEGFRRVVPDSHKAFLRGLQEEYQFEGGAFRHELGDRQNGPDRELFVVAGHSPVRSREPRIAETHALIDTGCGTLTNGRLTCLLWPSLRWFQVDAD